MSEAFDVLLRSGKDPSRPVYARLASGYRATEALSGLFADVGRAQEVCAASLRDALSKSKATLNELSKERDVGFDPMLSLWSELHSFISTVCKLHEQMGNAFASKISDPLKDMNKQYEMVKSQISGNAPRASSSGEDDKVKRRILAKIRIAQEEIGVAEDSREALLQRFGDTIKPDLLKKADDRLRRAQSLKKKAETELRQLDPDAANPPPDPPGGGDGLTAKNIKYLERAETSRVLRTLDCFRLGARLYFTFLDAASSPLAALCSACEAYSPQYDLGCWLTKVTGISTEVALAQDSRRFALEEADILWLEHVSTGGGDNALADMQNRMSAMKALVTQKEREIATLRDQLTQGFPQGEPALSDTASPKDEMHRTPASPTELPAPKESKKAALPGRSVSIKSPSGGVHPSETSDEESEGAVPRPGRRTPPPPVNATPLRESVPTSSPVDSTASAGLLQRMATAVGIKSRVPPSEDDQHSWEEDDPRYDYDNPQGQADEEDSFRLSDYIPSLGDRLRITWPPETKFPDRALEVERRLEEYLWSLRNSCVDDLARIETWDHDEYVKPLDYEYGFNAYIHKFPKNTLYTAYATVRISRALEWGSVYMTTRQWQLFSYETLLLAHQVSQRILQTRELTTLPLRDVSGLPSDTFETHLTRKAVENDRNFQETGALNEAVLDIPGRTESASQTRAAQILLYNASNQKKALRQWRIRLGLSAKENSALLTLLLPNNGCGDDVSHSPLDVRYRLHRLALSWHNAKDYLANAAYGIQKELFREWVFRNLHFVRVSVLMRLQRLARFLPQLNGITKWLSTWLITQDWCVYVQASLPDPLKVDDDFARNNISKLLNAFKLIIIILSDLFNAHFADEWGVNLYANNTLNRPVEIVPYQPKQTRTLLLLDPEEDPKAYHHHSTFTGLPKIPLVTKPARPRTHYSDDEDDDDSIPLDTLREEEDPDPAPERCEGSTARKNYPGFGFKNPEGFLRLGALMSCVCVMDSAIRADVAQDEREMMSMERSSEGGARNRVASADDDALSDDNPQVLGSEEFHDLKKFDIFAAQSHARVDVYWQYELPCQHLVLLEAASLVADPRQANRLTPDILAITQVCILLNQLLQHGIDPTTTSEPLRIAQIGTSLDTIRTYLIRAIWQDVLESKQATRQGADDDFNFDVGGFADEIKDRAAAEDCALPEKLVLAVEPLQSMAAIATDFVGWFMSLYDGSGSPQGPGYTSTNLNASNAPSPSETVTVRLLNCSLHNLFDALELSRGALRQPLHSDRATSVGELKRLSHATDPDFGVIDFGLLDEVAHQPSFFHQLENIRNEPEGVSLILPSRVERMIGELCLRRAGTNTFRTQMFLTLADYRQYYDTSSLPIALDIWQKMTDLLLLTPPKAAPQALHASQLQSLVSLPLLLNGPIAQYDLWRHFICSTTHAVFDRCFADALETIRNPREEESWFLPRLVDFEDMMQSPSNKTSEYEGPQQLDDVQEIEKAWSKVISKFGGAARRMIQELRTEIVHYTEIWATLLPGNQHAMITMYAAEGRFRSMLSELRQSPYWPEDTLPPSSAALTASLSQFEKLLTEVRLCSRFDNLLAENESLTAPFSASIASALSKRLKSIEPMLNRCIQDDWKPIDPPQALYSSGAVDFFQFVHHVLSAIWEYESATEWVVPILLQFVLRISRQYGDKMKATVAEPRLQQISKYADQVIANLTTPAPRVDISIIGQLIGKHKKKGGLKNLFGFGGTKHKPKAAFVTTEMGDDGDMESGRLGELDGGDMESNPLSQPVGNQELPPGEISEELKELAARIGPSLAIQLYNIAGAFEGTPNSSIKAWLTRLHNLYYYQNEIGNLGQRILQMAAQQDKVINEQSEVMLAMEKAGGRRVALANNENPQNDEQMQVWQSQLQETLIQSRQLIGQRAAEISRQCALRIVYLDLSEDLFEDIYQPSFVRGHSLGNLVTALEGTVIKFVNASPAAYKEHLLKEIFVNLVKAWLMLVTELGYMGHQFTADDVEAIDADFQALKSFAQTYGINPQLEVVSISDGQPAGTKTVDVFKLISDFVVFLGTQPHLLAQLGGNYDKKKPAAAGADVLPAAEEDEDDEDVKNMFAGLGTASPAFKAEEIIGKKKRGKGVFGGAMKLLKKL